MTTAPRLATSRDLPVGDLLESGEWAKTVPGEIRHKSVEEMRSNSPNEAGRLLAAYVQSVPDVFGLCRALRTSGNRIGWCLLPAGHRSRPSGVIDVNGKGHRVYLFSPRDSAQILAAMRRRLDA